MPTDMPGTIIDSGKGDIFSLSRPNYQSERAMVRPARSADQEALVVLMQEFQTIHCKTMSERFSGQSNEVLRSFIKCRRADPNAEIFLAQIDNGTIGYAMVQTLEEETPFSKRIKIGYLEQLFVTSRAQGNGVGGNLIQACCTWASGRGVSRIELDVFETNPKAFEIYIHCGFRVMSHRLTLEL